MGDQVIGFQRAQSDVMAEFNVKAARPSYVANVVSAPKRRATRRACATGNCHVPSGDPSNQHLRKRSKHLIFAIGKSRADHQCPGLSVRRHSCASQRSEERHFVIVESREIGGQSKISVEVVCEGRASAMHVTDAIVVRCGHRAPERISEKPFHLRSVATLRSCHLCRSPTECVSDPDCDCAAVGRFAGSALAAAGWLPPAAAGCATGLAAGSASERALVAADATTEAAGLSVFASAVAFAALSASTPEPAANASAIVAINRAANLIVAP